VKIICIGRNYLAHVKELDNDLPDEPMFFMKPETALLLPPNPFIYPEFSKEIHYETELVLRICQTCHSVDEAKASDCYDAITVGIDFTARDLQRDCKAKGHPWEKAKAFDGAAAIGKLRKINTLHHHEHIVFSMKLNGEMKQLGHSSDMIFNFNKIVSHISRFVTLCDGDFVFTGTPQGVGEVHVGDQLELFLEAESVLSLNIM